ncbi:MAG: hypothetical protein JO100_00985 [Pseudonocardia sp.]|nr:hypothetical protein [Pseudonocardia sp.]
MAETVTIWSDIHCPWAAITVHRLRAARDAAGLDICFDQRPWPLELVNDGSIPYRIVIPETTVLANVEPAIFSAFQTDVQPSTMLPAFELVAAARRVHGLCGAEEVDYQLRLGYFRDSVDVSIRAGLVHALTIAAKEDPELDPKRILEVWETEPVRADVLSDFRRSRDLAIQGSPQVFWPDGSTTHNPGMTDHQWVRGIPRLCSTDDAAPGRLLREKLRLRHP